MKKLDGDEDKLKEPIIPENDRYTNPEYLLPQGTLQIIKRYSKSKKDFKNFDKNNPMPYTDCTTYSTELKKLLVESGINSEDIFFFSINKSFDTINLYGIKHKFPSGGLHMALYIENLNLVIEPQTGKILRYSNNPDTQDPYASNKYYESFLGVEPGSLHYALFSGEFMSKIDYFNQQK